MLDTIKVPALVRSF